MMLDLQITNGPLSIRSIELAYNVHFAHLDSSWMEITCSSHSFRIQCLVRLSAVGVLWSQSMIFADRVSEVNQRFQLAGGHGHWLTARS